MGHRRDLGFDRLADVMPEVDRLLLGHATSKDWTLGQILHHLASAIRLTVEAVEIAPTTPADREPSRTFDVRRRRFFRAGRFPEGIAAPHPALSPPREADERAEAESLRSALRQLEGSAGPFPAHPLLGPLSKEEWKTFHILHCAHHLGFAQPTSPAHLPGGDPP